VKGDMPGKDQPRVVMLAAEASPYAKVGGLGDVLGALPKALNKLGAAVSVIMPAYGNAGSETDSSVPCEAVPGFHIPMDSSYEYANIRQTQMKGSAVDVYRIGSRKYFDRSGIYDDPVTKEGYPDNMERFIFFMKAAIELIRRIGVPFDIIHCHDSHSALVPGLIQRHFGGDPSFTGAGTLFTIHNLAYQGIYPKEALELAGIAPYHFYPSSPFEFWGQVNFMKAGIELADKVNTVSQTYAGEIRTDPELGLGLEGVLQNRKDDLSGIINGIDYEEWNPATDPLIPARFSTEDLSGKAKCKNQLLRRFNLKPSRKRRPLLGVVSRLADQKGFDLIAEAVEEIAALDMQMLVLGTGQQKYHDLFQEMAARFPDKIGIQLAFDNELAHQIEAGCDMFLMPSKYEPCGLNQLYSFRYGTIPIVRKTGGLADTVIPFDQENGTGFCFSEYSAEAMVAAIRKALEVFSDVSRWWQLMHRAMTQDWSWDNSARQYLQLYQVIYSGKHQE
jgi:starch synthase